MKEKFINKQLYILQRKSNRNLFIIFSLLVALMLVVVVSLFPIMQEVVKELPSEISSMINMGSIASYFNTEALELWIFLVSIYAGRLAINLTTNEFRNGSFEMIYTLNISRGEIVRTKLLRLVINVLYINLIGYVVSLVSLFIFGNNDFSVVNLTIYALAAFIVTLQVAICVFSLGLINKDRFSSVGGILVVLVMFLLTTISMMTEKTEWLGYLSPMSTMNGTIMLDGVKGLFTDGILLGVWSVICGLLLLISSKKFKNDDLC